MIVALCSQVLAWEVRAIGAFARAGSDWPRNRASQRPGSGGAGKGAEWRLNPCSPKRTPADDL